MKLLIIADDFTGALDTGVQLSKKQIPTCVYADARHLSTPKEDCEVLVINANLRHLAPADAYEHTERILRFFYQPGLSIYLKTDSVLRGNLSAVFAAAMGFLQKPLCFIPAFPSLGRTTKNATAYVNHDLLEHSVFRDDPRTPTLESYIPNIINKDYPMRCISVTTDALDTFSADPSASNTVYLFDCETNTQLQAIGTVIAEQSLYAFTAGCAGFAATFATHISFETKGLPVIENNRPCLFVNGSANAVTFRQLAYAKDRQYPILSLSTELYSYIRSNTDNLDLIKFYEKLTFQKNRKEAENYLQQGKSVILTTAADKNELLDLSFIKDDKKIEESIHNFIAEYTSTLVKSIVDTANPQNIVIFGGDMAAAIMHKCGYRKMTATGEITAGVPVCRIYGENGRFTNLVTKSGGFGDERTIETIERFFATKKQS